MANKSFKQSYRLMSQSFFSTPIPGPIQFQAIYTRSWCRYVTNSTAKYSASQIIPGQKSMAIDQPVNSESTSTSTVTTQDDLPWYLRSSSTPQVATQKAKPEIPPLPLNPPDLLQPILTYLVTARSPIHSLSLLDLRSHDPSPSLGSNLLMAIGTGASPQHVHAFSDRLCRWLRAGGGPVEDQSGQEKGRLLLGTKLRPTSDGLIGRQTAKVWRRRAIKKVRKMALRAGVDAARGVEERVREDGICEWVVVNVNLKAADIDVLEANKSFEEMKEGGLIGFDERAKSITLAVHVMTESKRKELDLEGYWNKDIEDLDIEEANDDSMFNRVPTSGNNTLNLAST